jgi:hypothetical protein
MCYKSIGVIKVYKCMLQDWDPRDEPLDQHSKYSFSCSVVRNEKSSNTATDTIVANPSSEEMEIDNGDLGVKFLCVDCGKENCDVSLPCGHMTRCVKCFQEKDCQVSCSICSNLVMASVKAYIT